MSSSGLGPSRLVPVPPSLEMAAQKLEAGQRRALAYESEVAVPPRPSLEEVAAQQLEAAPQKPEVHQAIEAAPQKPSQAVDLQAWQATGIAKNRVVDCHPWAAVGELMILLLWLGFWITSTGSGEQPVPAPGHSSLGSVSSQPCSWNWRAFRCSTGCKPRMHWPGLERSCTLYTNSV